MPGGCPRPRPFSTSSAGGWWAGTFRSGGPPSRSRPWIPGARAYGYRWRRERGLTEEFRVPHDIFTSNDYRDSPIRAVIENGGTARYRLEDENQIQSYPLL